MEITKAVWSGEGDDLSLHMPFSKVDKEQRLVSGFATLDNVDRQGDVVLSDASAEAFSKFAGNIREMHQPIAAGRMVSFKQDEFYDAEHDKTYKGIFVTVRVSKGAQPTWEKVLDGTLTGFSIHGKIHDQESVWQKSDNGDHSNVRIVKSYDLDELSLVDVPANQLSTVFSIQKNADGSAIVKGMVAETTFLNVFWCAEHKVSKVADSETAECSFCGNEMGRIGTIEDASDRENVIRETVRKYLDSDSDITKGGVANVTVENDEKVVNEDEVKTDAEVDATDKEADADAAVAAEGDEVEKADDAEGETDGNTELQKVLDEFKKGLADNIDERVSAAVSKLSEESAELAKAFDEKTSELAKGLAGVEERLSDLKAQTDEVQKGLRELEDGTGLKKSSDVESEDASELSKRDDAGDNESPFGGAFLTISNM